MRLSSLVICLVLAGCTSLSTSVDRSTPLTSRAVTGIPYSLPMLQYEIKVTRTLAQCFEPDANGQPTAVPHVLFTSKVEATPRYVPGETYLVDYRALAGFTKITSLSLDYHESSGTLHNFNASAEDRSAQIIQSGIRTVTSLAALAAGIPPPPVPAAGGPAPVPQMLVCAPGAQALLNAVADRTADVKTATTTLEGITERITLLTEQARLNSISDAGREELTGQGGLIERQRQATRALTTAQTRLERAQQAVGSTVQLRWPRAFPASQDMHRPDPQLETMIALDEPGLGRLAHLLARAPSTAGENGEENGCGTNADTHQQAIRSCLAAKLSVGLVIDRLGPAVATAGADDPGVVDTGAGAQGLFIRPPVRGRLIACQLAGEARCSEGAETILLRTDDAVVPQLGQLRFLPFRNGMLQNNALSLSLRVDGSVERFEYKESAARGEALAAIAETGAGQANAFAQGLRARHDAAAAAAEAQVTADRTETLSALRFQIDQLTLQRQLDGLTQPPAVSQLAAVQAETEQVNARVALLQAQLAERAAAAALASAPQ